MSRFLSIALFVAFSMVVSAFPSTSAIPLNGSSPINMRLTGAGVVENPDSSKKSLINATCILTDFEVACGSVLSMSWFSKCSKANRYLEPAMYPCSLQPTYFLFTCH